MLSLAPFLQFSGLLIAGIWSHRFFSFQSEIALWLQIGLIAIVLLAGGYFHIRRSNKAAMVLLSIACYLLGMLGATIQQRESLRLAKIIVEPYDGYVAIIKTLPEKRSESYRYEAEITHLIRKDQNVKFYGSSLVQIPLDSDEILQPGSIIRVNQNLKKPIKRMNPGSFDYGEYLSFQGIYYVDYLRNGRYELLGNERFLFNPVTWSYWISEKADEIFRSHIKDDDAYGLVKAMILGRRDDLRGELVDAFTISGAVHILSVSGLHVGIFFVVIQSMLGWLRKFRYGKYIQLGILSVMLLMYGLMTGMPASVERSVIMCLMLAVAATFAKNQIPLNTLGVAAYLILLIDPGAIYAIGFQLSFLAMIGLMVFNKPIERMFQIKNKWVRYIWSMIAATLAAQITTLPLTLYYFHQFPTWFLLVNPLVIVVSGVLLPASFLLLAISWFPVEIIVTIVAFIVSYTAILTNIFVTIPTYLPVRVIENIPFDFVQLVMLLIVILLFGWLGIAKSRKESILLTLSFCLVFAAYSIVNQLIIINESRLVLHSIKNQSLISILDNGKLFLITTVPLSEQTYKFTLKDYVVQNQVSDTTYILPGQQALGRDWQVTWNGKEPIVRYSGTSISSGSDSISVSKNNILLAGRDLKSYSEGELTQSNFIILDNQLKFNQRKQWRDFLANKELAFMDLSSDGGFIVRK